ncbi:UDP-3-O-acyl-N-acetylglucosamine deacetylase [Geotalea uraniireducens]|uniref:UDP-3-O-acyl-N-acetylglucosamine deacetylase n=1 Tax=Geotalea uraniireducens (strain Rf4) TaxID=351605 RepID=LPXC_GEOUR|nr:UDP-3-O-acyl-N-acetylglucosamine deacetylase [Geotalea uraniireducens]A5GA17.1 RecName: Full=UDP-3-O-acyl-N-acetylglucosamine deacetylase; Short=UDP-3-O-acyl-GlcNAc deacetylase; AltName: Full=UDP-3-O-[R-3-hydroxymyristoyl]-N-acetylglucosamine deacetylase [Geotalea uraniireducens Rf4]ABQ25588.1 UDP-3-O-[3-hydroxymyristoyl] N-acetylglucosamine deacetylase [Geotalea uraniireducens Rf4]
MAFQQTLKNKVAFSGIGLHSGKEITLTLRPADAGNGIVFHRIDTTPPVSIEARTENVVSTRLSTTIGKNGAAVSTIEHLMAALFSCGIDNAHVDINGPEVPIMDGSAAPFVEGIRNAGSKSLSKSRKYLVVKKPVTIRDGDKRITVLPSRYYRISFDMHFNHPVINRQFRTMKFDRESFADDFSPARTFGFLAEIEALMAHGLALGASLENAVGIDDNGIVNPEGLRFTDEFVRHKILDSIGDFALAGVHLVGHVKACKSGHELNHKFITELLSRSDCWSLMELTPPENKTASFPISLPEMAWLEAC